MGYGSRYTCPPCGLAVLCCDCGLRHEAHGAYPLPPLEEPDDDVGDDGGSSPGSPPERGGRRPEKNRTPPKNDDYRDGVRDTYSGNNWNAPSAAVLTHEPVAQLREVASADPELFGEDAVFLASAHTPSHPAEKIVGASPAHFTVVDGCWVRSVALEERALIDGEPPERVFQVCDLPTSDKRGTGPQEPSHRKCTYCGHGHAVEDCLKKQLKLRPEASREQVVAELDRRMRRGDYTVIPPDGPCWPR